MAEKVTVRMNNRFQAEFLSAERRGAEAAEPQPVAQMGELSPYGMLLSGLGSCTAMVMLTYARNHDVKLDAVELRLAYDRVFLEDCENCENIDRYEERIEEEITLTGELDETQRQKLFAVSKLCPIHKMLESGAEIHSVLL